MNFTQTAKLYAPVFATVAGIVSTVATNNIFTLFGCFAAGLVISGICALNSIAESTPVKPQNVSSSESESDDMFIVNPNTANCFISMNSGMNIGGHTNFL